MPCKLPKRSRKNVSMGERCGWPMFLLWGIAIVPGVVEAGGYDRPVGPSWQGRSVTVARHGMVATSHPLAAQAGLAVLQAGGNAADAAIAANAVLGVVEPMSCGIGGDLFVLYWDNRTRKLYGLNASGRSPRQLTREVFQQRGLKQIPLYGPLSWSVPGCVSGWQMLQDRFGRRSLAANLQPAIELAEEGFPVTEVIASYWRSAAQRLRQWPDSAATFLVDGQRAPRFAELFRNPNLANTYRLIAAQGAKAFYEGPIAEQIVAFSQQNGGFFTLEDFRRHQSNWVEPVSTNYRGYDVWQLPPNGQGIAVLQMLNILEGYDLKNFGPGSAEWVHLFVEAKKLAYADRARYYADPEFAEVPVAELISKPYAARRRQLIRMDQAAADVPPGEPLAGDTIYLAVVDSERNCCSLIQSLYYGFGSGMTPGSLGFALQNRGALFTLEPGHPNQYAPGKRPFHTIIPAMVTKDGKPWFCFGVMGGDMQPQGQVQVLVNIIDFGMNVQAAGDAARVRHEGDATPRGDPPQGVGTVYVESGISDRVVEKLRSLGHRVVRQASSAYGGYQGILIDEQHGVLHGATESRKDGIAIGY
ncbi:MAG: gamma-glutamyltranspeptidase [Pirellulaceae bacterium]|nr:MAG: gamma-glutamyltranspeptidase [Pirellulaceae bacterium]